MTPEQREAIKVRVDKATALATVHALKNSIMDIPNLLSALEAAEAERDALKAALKPFARVAEMEGDEKEDTKSVFVALGRLRAARRALEANL